MKTAVLMTQLAALCLGAAGSAPSVDALLARRLTHEATVQVVAELESRAMGAPRDAKTWAALLQAEHYVAIHYLEGDEAEQRLEASLQRGLNAIAAVTGLRHESLHALVHDARDIPKEAAELLYWTAVGYGRLIPTRSIFERPRAATTFYRALLRVTSMDETVFHGAAHRALARYMIRAPGFLHGSTADALQHARRAFDLAPAFASNAVILARVIQASGRARDEIPKILALGAAADENAFPADLPEQRRAITHARAQLDDSRS